MRHHTRIVRRYVPDEEVDYVLQLLRGDGCRMVEQTRRPGGLWTLIADCPAANVVTEHSTQAGVAADPPPSEALAEAGEPAGGD